MASVVKVHAGICRVRTEVLGAGHGLVALKLKTIPTLHSDNLLRIRIQFRVLVVLEDVRNYSGDVEDVYETVADHLAIALIVLTKEVERRVIDIFVNIENELSIGEDGIGQEIKSGSIQRVAERAWSGNVQTEEFRTGRKDAPVVVYGIRRRRETGVPFHFRELNGEFSVGLDAGSVGIVIVRQEVECASHGRRGWWRR